MTFISQFIVRYKIMEIKIVSLYLNEFRKNLAAPGKLLLSSPKGAYCWCSTTYVPVGRALKHASAASPIAPTLVQPSLTAKAITFGLRLASTCFRSRRDPIGLVQRFPGYGYASAGDRSTLVCHISPDLRSLHATCGLANYYFESSFRISSVILTLSLA